MLAEAPAFDLPAFVAARPPRAAGFIVTLYGDAIRPRGGEAGMAAIIEICAQVGISETLVRTAVSRLVAAGQLAGRRVGRRSFYRLTPAAAAEFAAAAQVIYAPPAPCGWRLVAGPEAVVEGLAGHARLRAGLALGPDRGPLPADCAVVAGPAAGDSAALAGLAAQLWDLDAPADAYAAVMDRFGPIVDRVAGVAPEAALALRLLLVDDWRRAVLADPRLPPEAWPPGWPGPAARVVFLRLYKGLTPAAEAAIGTVFAGLPPRTVASTALLAALDASQENMNLRLIRDMSEGIR
jgi:phenylacetic acid degradation operon negative regulatory protein